MSVRCPACTQWAESYDIKRVTPEELRERGYEGESSCRCRAEEVGGYTACTPTLCEAAILVERVRVLEEALADLHAEVEMAESVGICLPSRVPSLRAGQLLAPGSGEE